MRSWWAILPAAAGLPHGMCQTHKDIINKDLLAFIQGTLQVTASTAGI
jgi:hypothetical protein